MKESKKGLEENRASDLSTSFGGGEFVQEKTSKPLKNPLGWGLREHGAPGKGSKKFPRGGTLSLSQDTSLPLSDLGTRVLAFPHLAHVRGCQAGAIRLLPPFSLTGGPSSEVGDKRHVASLGGRVWPGVPLTLSITPLLVGNRNPETPPANSCWSPFLLSTTPNPAENVRTLAPGLPSLRHFSRYLVKFPSPPIPPTIPN